MSDAKEIYDDGDASLCASLRAEDDAGGVEPCPSVDHTDPWIEH